MADVKKIALVTGSSRGIGRGIAERLSRDGFHVVASATARENEALVRSFAEQGVAVDYIGLDISSEEDRTHALAWIRETYGRIDLLVNNAGVAPTVRADILETSRESFRRLMHINLEGCFFMCQLFANEMVRLVQAGTLPDYRPRIVNISSISAYTSSTSRGEYCISKAGLAMATELFAARLAGEGIRVYEIRPGIIRTDMTAVVTEKYEAQIAAGLLPIARMGTPEDIACAVSALAGGALPYSTGEVINVDGGFHLRTL